ncbi:hypothetical protein J4475_02215, partial [Candidatus Woesearchaeota archaeon]|nr:hypothetical protein [Candidatus Woesearchaeota archaeon]
WFLYTHILNLSFAMPFTHSFGNVLSRGHVSIFQTLLLILWSVKNVFLWVLPPFFLLVAYAVAKRARAYLRTRKLELQDYLVLSGIFTFFLFTFVQQTAYGFPKYFIAMMPAFCVIAGQEAAQLVSRIKKFEPYLPALALIVLAFNFLALKDPFLEHNIFYTQSITFSASPSIYIFSNINSLIIVILPLLLALTLLMAMRNSNALFLSLAIVMIAMALSVNIMQAKAGYSTTYGYGQQGMEKAAGYVKAHTSENDTIISRSDIAYYAARKYYMSFPARQELIDNFYPIINSQNVTYIVTSPSEKLPDFSANFTSDAEFGHFKIYRKISRSPPLAQG